jgi:hypothetical protein
MRSAALRRSRAETDVEVVRRLRGAGARIGFGVTTPAAEHPLAAGITLGGYADSS